MIDLQAFLLVLLIALVGFANAFFVLYRKVPADTIGYEDTTNVDFRSVGSSLLSSYAMMIGAFDTRAFTRFQDSTLSTMLFVVYMLFIFIIMLNVIIAIIGDSYGEAKAKKNVDYRTESGAMIVESKHHLHQKHSSHLWLQILVPDNSPIVDSRYEGEKKRLRFDDITEIKAELAKLLAASQQATQTNMTLYRTATMAKRKPLLVVKLESIGQLGLIPTHLQLKNMSRGRSNMYEVTGMDTHPFLNHLGAVGLLNTGQFSVPMPLPPSSYRMELDIPSRATQFAVAHPLGGVYHLETEHKNNLAAVDASFMFLLYGGVLFLGEHSEILRANAFLPGGGEMMFEPRRVWDHRFTEQLHKARRFNSITVQSFRDQGAMLFAWLRPNEKFIVGDEVLSDWPFGAFVYLFHKDPMEHNELDCYFTIAPTCTFAKVVSGQKAPVE